MASFHSPGLSSMNESNTVDERNQSQNVQGDFNGQLANGNISNHIYGNQERARLNGAEAKRIKDKALELIGLTGQESVKTWGRLKDIFGEGVNDLFRDQEKAAHVILDLWLEQAKNHNESSAKQQTDLLIQLSELKAKHSEAQSEEQKLRRQHAETTDRLRHAQQAYSNLEQQHRQQAASLNILSDQLRRAQDVTHRVSTHCISCSATSKELADAKNAKRLWIGGAFVMAVSTGMLGLLYKQAHAEAVDIGAKVQNCEYNGQEYRLGSVIDLPKAPDIRCTYDENKRSASWTLLRKARSYSSRKSANN